jgi:hypothetical protein
MKNSFFIQALAKYLRISVLTFLTVAWASVPTRVQQVGLTQDDTGTLTYVALIFFRPFDDFQVAGAFFHCYDSMILCLTSPSW